MFKKKNNMLLATILLALGGMNTAYAGAGLDCTSVATIGASNDDGTGDGTGTVTAEQVLACAEEAQADPARLAALATLIAADTNAGGDNLSDAAAKSLNSKGGTSAAATTVFLNILAADGVPNSVKNDAITALNKVITDNGILPANTSNGNAVDDILVAVYKYDKTQLPAGFGAAIEAVIAAEVLPTISRNNLGQVLIYPYYTTLGTKESLINVFNTSNKTIAAKVRFHEAHNSRGVLGFTVVLSPYDKWSGTIKNKDGAVKFYTSDTTCTVPEIGSDGIALRDSAYNGNGLGADAIIRDAGNQGKGRLNKGYIEIIAMGEAGDYEVDDKGAYLSGSEIAYNARLVKNTPTAGKTTPRNCAAVRAAFAPSPLAVDTVKAIKRGDLPPTAFANVQTGQPTASGMFDKLSSGNNPLRGALVIVDQTEGVGFGTNAVAIEDFNASPGNLITAQEEPFFHEPSIASRNGLWSATGLADVEQALAAGTIVNEWANNLSNGANVDWVVQFPTKAFHVDCGVDSPRNFQSAINQYRKNKSICDYANYAPFTSPFGADGSPVLIDMSIYDKEENAIVSNKTPVVSFSPNNVPDEDVLALPWGTNVITFSGKASGSPSVLSSDVADLRLDPVATVDDSTGAAFLTENNGMAMMNFIDKKAYLAALAANVTSAIPKNYLMNLPVVGFAAKQRNQGDATKAYGQMMNHSYIGRN
jgi:hypothetical protein